MGTRANIIAKTSDGGWWRIYTHWDGYPDHHGPILLDHYQDQAKIDQLIALGDLSILGEEIGRKHPFEPSSEAGRAGYDKKYGKMCKAYGRDRGETEVEPKPHPDIETACKHAIEQGAEFIYVWNGQSWAIGVPEQPDELIPLREFMQGERELKQTVKAFGTDFIVGTKTVRAGA